VNKWLYTLSYVVKARATDTKAAKATANLLLFSEGVVSDLLCAWRSMRCDSRPDYRHIAIKRPPFPGLATTFNDQKFDLDQ